MNHKEHLLWPFFEERHRILASELDAWAGSQGIADQTEDVDSLCRDWVRRLGNAGWLRHAIGGTAYDGHADAIDTRAICLIRETLARHSGLADFAFAMQGLGSGAERCHREIFCRCPTTRCGKKNLHRVTKF